MRTIKFRAWDGNSMLYEGWNGDFFATKEIIFRYDRVQQFTGLLDKNGKEIYEGDIMKSVPTMQLDETIIISVVQWDEPRGMWVAYAIEYDEKEYLFEAIKPHHETEIIGSIYETPHLLTSPRGQME